MCSSFKQKILRFILMLYNKLYMYIDQYVSIKTIIVVNNQIIFNLNSLKKAVFTIFCKDK